MFDPINEKANPEIFWNLADRWFRLIEMALIIGTLSYFKTKTHNLAVVGVYWISWIALYWWFIELGESFGKQFSGRKSVEKKWAIWSLSLGIMVGFFYGITEVTRWLIEQQN